MISLEETFEDQRLRGRTEGRKLGYHVKDIPEGLYGYASKILEEAHELDDAVNQGCKVMQLVELSDIIGAIQAFLENHHPGTTMDDLIAMAKITRRAFESGERK